MVTDRDWESDDLAPLRHRIWDLIVIGGGTAGIVAAKTAADLGAEVLLIERGRTGGDCLWTGCVPSKTLLSAAHAAAATHRQGDVPVGFGDVMERVQEVIATIEPIDSPERLRECGVRVVHGDAVFTSPDTVEVNRSSVSFNHAVVATGTEPSMPPVPGLVEAAPLTSRTVWGLTELPARLVVLGGGSIGCELGQAFGRLGAHVTLVEVADRLLVHEDPDAAQIVAAALRQDGVRVVLGAAVEQVAGREPAVVTLDSGEEIIADRLLVAAGRQPSLDTLGLDAAGVDVGADGFVAVTSALRTSNHRIYAAGDITGHPQFTHVAATHGSLAASNAVLGLWRKVELEAIPRVTYTQPELAAFGLGAAGAGLTTRTVPHTEVDRAVAEGRTDGFSRLVIDKRGRVVGATIVGARAGETLAEVTLAARHGLRARDLAASMHPYPTYGDGISKAAVAQVQHELSGGVIRAVISILVRLRRRWSDRGRVVQPLRK